MDLDPTGHVLIALASTLCMLAVVAQARSAGSPGGDSAWFESTLALPLYAAGIVQWFLFGLTIGEPILLGTCLIQLVALGWLLVRYTRRRLAG